MTDPRIQAIRERHAKNVRASLRKFGGINHMPVQSVVDTCLAEANAEFSRLLGQLEAAQSQAKEHAALMREALIRLLPIFVSPSSHLCRACLRDSRSGQEHEPDCIVTKLRDAADQAEGEV